MWICYIKGIGSRQENVNNHSRPRRRLNERYRQQKYRRPEAPPKVLETKHNNPNLANLRSTLQSLPGKGAAVGISVKISGLGIGLSAALYCHCIRGTKAAIHLRGKRKKERKLEAGSATRSLVHVTGKE